MTELISSKILFERAQQCIPGGVNSPVRAFKSVGGTPIFIKSAQGAYLQSEDGHQYIDYINSWGPMIMGHAFEPVVQAIQQKARDSTSFGAPTLLEIEMAELIKKMAPNVDLIRMVSSGTEACMSALRLAKGYTRRNKFIKFEGCYHGHADPFLVKAGSGLATLDIQEVPGVTQAVAQDTLVCRYNDLEDVAETIAKYPEEIAAIILEPQAGNMGCILPREGFLEGLRNLCDKHGIVLIFDEVMTGFRLAAGGAQERFGVDADLVTYGKVIGAGMPVGAFGGKREIMEHIAPLGNVYQAGTLSGNPLAMVAGLTLLQTLHDNPNIYTELEARSQLIKTRLSETFAERSIPVQINQLGSMISLHFATHAIESYEDAAKADSARFNKFFHLMLQEGIYLPPSAFETWFVSYSIQEEEIDKTIEATRRVLDRL